MTAARLTLDVASSEADVMSGRLWSLGTIGIEEQRGPFLIRLLADFADESSAEAARQALGRGEIETVTSDEWLENWREYARVTRAGQRFVIRPIWLDHRTEPNQVVIHLDPGRAFGSGSHPSTRLALAHMEAILEGDESVLDVGCGTGVLAIGAARIGATSVDAIDIDPDARLTAESNSRRNGVGDIVHVLASPIEELEGSYGLVIANILGVTLIEIAADLTRLVAVNGTLLISGILDQQGDDLAAGFGDLEEIDRSNEDGWTAIVFRQRR